MAKSIVPTADQRATLEALQRAGELYERYLSIAKLTEIPESTPQTIDQGVRSWDQPLGLPLAR